MNKFFIEGEGSREIPRRAYARLDQFEAAEDDEAGEVMIAFDAVDAAWLRGDDVDLSYYPWPEVDDDPFADFWQQGFGKGDNRSEVDLFASAPLYQIEFSLPRGHDWIERLQAFEPWFVIELSGSGEIEADVYGGLFDEPQRAFLAHEPRQVKNAEALDRIFGMQFWPDASREDLEYILRSRCKADQLAVFDVGQGSASAVICECGKPIYYFDAGCGVYRNAKTRPATIAFCCCDNPPVILSHWDADHWAGACIDTDMLRSDWIAPRQTIGPKHTAFASMILAAKGRLHIMPPGTAVQWSGAQNYALRRCSGPSSDRNASGLTLWVEDRATSKWWILTGDAGYHVQPLALPSDIAGLIVPHHGANMGSASVPPACPTGYSRLVYSFGPGNAHGKTGVSHPTASAITVHAAQGWAPGGWVAWPGGVAPASPVAATAINPSTHLGGMAVGWTAPPNAPAHYSVCPKAMPLTPV